VATMENGTPLDLTNQELTSIEQYRLRRQTSVLVILFTDIKGFTEIAERRGDRHATDLLHQHDEIVVKAIEEGGAGLVVKHIGDSVMAVFAEPSTAVERALRIQEEIDAFNEAHPELETFGVRIGLHMGQVAVENQAQFDLVGRHVNRASRVEALADAGQIYLTYPVFDSARGWLRYKSGGHVDWKLHGNYLLKGLDEPVEIYEVVDKRRQKPVPPKNARRKYKLFPVWLALGVLAVGAAAAFGVTSYQRTEVFFTNWNRELTIVDQKQILALEGERGQETRRSITPLPVGRHLLQQDINYQVRNYMEIEIKRGMNVIPPGMVSVYLPALERRLNYQPGHEEQVEAQQTYTYPLYDKDNRRLDTKAELSLSLKGEPDKDNPNLVVFRCTWKVVENGAVVGTDTFEMKSQAAVDDYQNRKVVIQADALHYWYLRTYTNRRSAELEIGAAYIEYKDK
jgi:class 3 adenylate cyclase